MERTNEEDNNENQNNNQNEQQNRQVVRSTVGARRSFLEFESNQQNENQNENNRNQELPEEFLQTVTINNENVSGSIQLEEVLNLDESENENESIFGFIRNMEQNQTRQQNNNRNPENMFQTISNNLTSRRLRRDFDERERRIGLNRRDMISPLPIGNNRDHQIRDFEFLRDSPQRVRSRFAIRPNIQRRRANRIFLTNNTTTNNNNNNNNNQGNNTINNNNEINIENNLSPRMINNNENNQQQAQMQQLRGNNTNIFREFQMIPDLTLRNTDNFFDSPMRTINLNAMNDIFAADTLFSNNMEFKNFFNKRSCSFPEIGKNQKAFIENFHKNKEELFKQINKHKNRSNSNLGCQGQTDFFSGNMFNKYLYVKCLDCQMVPNRAICINCFMNSDHKNHRFVFRMMEKSKCDCGDPNFWKIKNFCKDHSKAQEIVLDKNLKNEILKSFAKILNNYFASNDKIKEKKEFDLFSWLIVMNKEMENNSVLQKTMVNILNMNLNELINCDLVGFKAHIKFKYEEYEAKMISRNISQINKDSNSEDNLDENSFFNKKNKNQNNSKNIKVKICQFIDKEFVINSSKNLTIFDFALFVWNNSNKFNAHNQKSCKDELSIPFKIENTFKQLIMKMSCSNDSKRNLLNSFLFQKDILLNYFVDDMKEIFKQSFLMDEIYKSNIFKLVFGQTILKMNKIMNASSIPTLSQVSKIKEMHNKNMMFFFTNFSSATNDLTNFIKFRNLHFFVFVTGLIECYLNLDYDVLNLNNHSFQSTDNFFKLNEKFMFVILSFINQKLSCKERQEALMSLSQTLLMTLFMVEHSKFNIESGERNKFSIYQLLRMNFTLRFLALAMFNLLYLVKGKNINNQNKTTSPNQIQIKKQEQNLFEKLFEYFSEEDIEFLHDSLIRNILFFIKRKAKIHRKHEDVLNYEIKNNYDKFYILIVKIFCEFDSKFKIKLQKSIDEQLENIVVLRKDKHDNFSLFFKNIFYFLHEIFLSEIVLEYFYFIFAINQKNQNQEILFENIYENCRLTGKLLKNFLQFKKTIKYDEAKNLFSFCFKKENSQLKKDFVLFCLNKFSIFEPKRKMFFFKDELIVENSYLVENLFYLRDNFKEIMENSQNIGVIDLIKLHKKNETKKNESLDKIFEIFYNLFEQLNSALKEDEKKQEYRKVILKEIDMTIDLILRIALIFKKFGIKPKKLVYDIISNKREKFSPLQNCLSENILSRNSDFIVGENQFERKIRNQERVNKIFKKIRQKILKQSNKGKKKSKVKKKNNINIKVQAKEELKNPDNNITNNNINSPNSQNDLNHSEVCIACQNPFEKKSDMFFIVKKNKIDPFKLMILQKYWNNKKPLINMNKKYFSKKNSENKESEFDDKNIWMPNTCGHPYHFKCLNLPHKNGKYKCNFCKLSSSIKLGLLDFVDEKISNQIITQEDQFSKINNIDKKIKIDFFDNLIKTLFPKKMNLSDGVSIYSILMRPIEYIPKMMRIWKEDIFLKRIYPCLIFFVNVIINLFQTKKDLFYNFSSSCIILVEPIDSFLFSPHKMTEFNYFEMSTGSLLTSSVEMLFVKLFIRRFWIEFSKNKIIECYRTEIGLCIETVLADYFHKCVIVKILQKNIRKEDLDDNKIFSSCFYLIKMAILLKNMFNRVFISEIKDDQIKKFIFDYSVLEQVKSDEFFYEDIHNHLINQKKLPKKKRKRQSLLDSISFVDPPKLSISFFDLSTNFVLSYSELIYKYIEHMKKIRFSSPIFICGFCGKKVMEKTNHFQSFHGNKELYIEIFDDIKLKTKKTSKKLYESKFGESLMEDISNIEDFELNRKYFEQMKNNILCFNV